jgi:hypothetical protein
MALRAVVGHPKFVRLKGLLGCGMREALGTLEGLWHFCAKFTPRGDIGKYSDPEIESWLEWNGAPGALVAALLEARWVDLDPEHRLVVHDWEQHADDYVHTELAKRTLYFISGAMPRLSAKTLSGETRTRIRAEYRKAEPELCSGARTETRGPVSGCPDGVRTLSTPCQNQNQSQSRNQGPEPSPQFAPLTGPQGEGIWRHLPPELRTFDVDEAWRDFQRNRCEQHDVRPYQEAACRTFAQLVCRRRFSADDLVRLIRHCIVSGWKTIPGDVIATFELTPTPRAGLTEEQVEAGLR